MNDALVRLGLVLFSLGVALAAYWYVFRKDAATEGDDSPRPSAMTGKKLLAVAVGLAALALGWQIGRSPRDDQGNKQVQETVKQISDNLKKMQTTASNREQSGSKAADE